jgi:hypothetical protein
MHEGRPVIGEDGRPVRIAEPLWDRATHDALVAKTAPKRPGIRAPKGVHARPYPYNPLQFVALPIIGLTRHCGQMASPPGRTINSYYDFTEEQVRFLGGSASGITCAGIRTRRSLSRFA